MRSVPADAPMLSAAEMRAAERALFDAGVGVDELMERAGLAVAREVRRFAGGSPVLVLAGPGDNGGDAYVAARYLAEWGADVTVAALGRPKDGASARMAARWSGPAARLAEARPRPILVDGLFGTGATRPLGRDVAGPLARFRAAARFAVAIDLPSGVPADTGEGGFTPMTADVTVALGALKPAHLMGPAASASGHLILADIGVPVHAKARTLARPRLRLAADAHKYSRGMVVAVGGAMPGAARLAAEAALRGGAGYVLLAEKGPSADPPHAVVRRAIPEPSDLTALLADERVGAVVVGPGLGRDERARSLLDAALASAHPLVLDGDALSLMGPEVTRLLAARGPVTYLTPHAGEFDRMFPPGPSKLDRTRDAAARTGATVVHKGPDTVIADPDGRVRICADASPWLSTAGTGDVLAGLLAARHAARDEDPAAGAVWLHARAASRAGMAFAADDLATHLPAALADCDRA